MTDSKFFLHKRFKPAAQTGSETTRVEKTTVGSASWNEWFRHHPQNAMNKPFLESFYEYCDWIHADSDPMASNFLELNPLKSRDSVICFTNQDHAVTFYHAKFDASTKTHVTTPIIIPKEQLEIFSKYSYAALKQNAKAEIDQFLESFYAACDVVQTNVEPTDPTSPALQALQRRNGVICLAHGDEPVTFYYAEFDASKNQHVVTPIAIPEKQIEAFNKLVPEHLNVSQPATSEQLKLIRQVTDCMRFKTPAVLAIFDKRKSRKEALSNSNALLDDLIPDEFQFYDAAQVQHLDESLRFALYQYLAQAQAAMDDIGVVRSQHTELATYYRKIKQCTLYRKQLMLRQIDLDVHVLKQAKADNNDPLITALIAKYQARYKTLDWSTQKDSYEVLVAHQKALKDNWTQYEKLEVLHQDFKRIKSAQWLDDQETLHALSKKYSFNENFEALTTDIKRQRDELKDELNKLDAAIESLNPGQLKSYLPSFLKEDEDELDSDYILAQASKANMRRLFWVWTRCLIETLIITAHQTLLVSTMIAGWVSFLLYWGRGGVEATGGMQHAFDSWVSDREKVIAAHKRRLAHWEERRDTILNDLIWGSSNFACCFWLVGIGVLGTVGDSLTLVLLGMDLWLSVLRWVNGKSEYRDIIVSYHEQLQKLMAEMSTKIWLDTDKVDTALSEHLATLSKAYTELQVLQTQKHFVLDPWTRSKHAKSLKAARQQVELSLAALHIHLSGQTDASETDKNALLSTSLHLNALYSDQQAYLKRWQDKLATLIYDVAYAVALAVAFGLMCFSPIAGLGLFGAIFLGASTVLWRSAYAKDDIASVANMVKVTEKQYFKALEDFIELAETFKTIHDSPDAASQNQQLQLLDDQMKQLYLQMRALGAKAGYGRELARFKQIEFARDTFMRLVVPVAIALTLLLAPAIIAGIPTYVFLMLGVLIFALGISMAIHRVFKPKSSAWQKEIENDAQTSTAYFNSTEYLAFKRSVLVDKVEELSHHSSDERNPLVVAASKTEKFDPVAGKGRGQDLLNSMKKHRSGKNAQQMHLFNETYYKTNDEQQDRDAFLGTVLIGA